MIFYMNSDGINCFQVRTFLNEVNFPDLVLDIQFEILKLLSEKDDLIRKNEVLKHYRPSCMKLQKENSRLREKVELLQVLPSSKTETDGDGGPLLHS